MPDFQALKKTDTRRYPSNVGLPSAHLLFEPVISWSALYVRGRHTNNQSAAAQLVMSLRRSTGSDPSRALIYTSITHLGSSQATLAVIRCKPVVEILIDTEYENSLAGARTDIRVH